MTTRSFWLLTACLAGLIGLGLFTRRSELIALALPLLAYAALATAQAPGELRLRAQRHLSTDQVTQGMPVTVQLTVENEGPALAELHWGEQLPAPVQDLTGHLRQTAGLKSGGVTHLEYELRGWRGRYQFGSLPVEAIEPFGLFASQATLPAGGTLLVYPEVPVVPALPIHPAFTKGFSGPIAARKSGLGMDFFGVRQYQLGDSLRRINWKTSARHTVDLFTNEYEQERIADVGLILDARPHSAVTVQGRRLFEYAVQATAALAGMFLEEGHCLSMLIYGAGVYRIYPGYGKVQYRRIMQALAQADTGTNYALAQLRHIPIRLLPPHCQLVFVSPLAHSDLEALLRFRTQGYEVLVLSPDPVRLEWLGEPERDRAGFQLATRFAQVERELMFNTLRRAGVQIVDWPVDQPLAQTLEQFRQREHRYRRTARRLQ